MTDKKGVQKNKRLDRRTVIMANPRITLQEQPDRWGLLYDPDRDFSLGINPECVFLWKQMLDRTTASEAAEKIRRHYSSVPPGIEEKVRSLFEGFLQSGFALRSE